MTSPAIPIGGSTGLSHEHDARVDLAAQWLLETPQEALPRPLVPSLRSMFGLTASEAIEAIRQANRQRGVTVQ